MNRHIGEFLVPGDAEAPTSENLGALLAWAARGDSPATSVVVRPTNTFGVRYWARRGDNGVAMSHPDLAAFRELVRRDYIRQPVARDLASGRSRARDRRPSKQ